MKRAIIPAIACCAIASLAVAASNPPQKKAATPARNAAPAVAAVHPGKKGTPPAASHTGPTVSRSTTAHPATGVRTPTPAASVRTPAKPGTTRTTSRRYYVRQPVRRSYTPQQVSPSADRYREIQDALAAKGYLTTPSSGVWDKDSMAAMQRFQQDQNLEPTGKLTARSLSALGLGSKTAVVSAAVRPDANLRGNATSEATPLQ